MDSITYSTAVPFRCEPFSYRYHPSFAIGKHEHLSTVLMMMVDGQYVEKDDLGRTREIVAGHLLYMPQGCEHSHASCEAGATLVGLALSGEFMKEVDWRGLTEPIRVDKLQGLNSALSLLRACTNIDKSGTLDLEASALETLAEITATPLTGAEKSKPRWVDEACEFLHENHREDISLSELGKLLGVDRCHLARTFRRFTNKSLGGYLRTVRLEAACRMMLLRRMPIGEVAVTAGFYDHSHFTREFKKAFRAEPSQYVQAAGKLLPR